MKMVGGLAQNHLGPEAKATIKALIDQLNTPQGFVALEEISLLAGPEGPPIVAAVKAAQTTARAVFWVVMCCACISSIICFSTFVPSFTTKDEAKSKRLRGAWIAFLIFTLCMLLIGFLIHRYSSLSFIVRSQIKKFGLDLNS